MKFQKTEVYEKIDPQLQRLMERRQRGLQSPITSSTNVNEIAVMARVNDIDKWENMSEVQVGARIGKTENGDWLVTGRIPVQRIEAVRQADFVLSLKPARRMRSMLSKTLEETHARKDLLPDNTQGGQGAGVVVGIVDSGCDFHHSNFRNADGTTRVLAVWDQNGSASPDSPFGYGKLFTQEEINHALQQSDPYDALDYGPSPDSFNSKGAHGTHVMDIAAGNGLGSGTPGLAPEADIVFVHPACTDIPWGGPGAVGYDFGDSVQLLEAVRFIFDMAGNRPCVVNLSLGTNGGPHDGSNLFEQGIDAILQESPNRAVVIAASNSYGDGIHATDSVSENEYVDLLWTVYEKDLTGNELEIWYPASDEFNLEILSPDESSLGSLQLGENGHLTDDDGKTLLFASHRASDPNNGDHNIGMFVEDRMPPGVWTLRLHGVKINEGLFHAWIERDDRGQSSFRPPHDNSHTLGSISTSRFSIVVGSYDAHKTSTPLSWFSSAGPTRDGREKPEISAPGHDVWAAHSRTGDGVTRKSGTSMASPAITGIVALILSEAKARGVDLPIEKIRDIVLLCARDNPPEASAWDPRYGAGRIDAATAVEAVINQELDG